MKSVLHFLLDLVYDWDDIESYEYLAPGIDDESIDVLDIIDDSLDSPDMLRFAAETETTPGLGSVVYDLVTWGLETDQDIKSGDIEVPPTSVQGIPLWYILKNYDKYKSYEDQQEERVPDPSWDLDSLGF